MNLNPAKFLAETDKMPLEEVGALIRAQCRQAIATQKEVQQTFFGSSEERASVVKPGKLTDAEWVAVLKTDPTYHGIDIERELGKCRRWCEVNNARLSRKRFTNWINNARPELNGPAANGAAQNQRNAWIGGGDEWDKQASARISDMAGKGAAF